VSTTTGEQVDDDLWSAIGDPTRRRLLDLLLLEGGGTATSLGRQLPVTRQAVAKHLGVLDRAGLLEERRQGREVLFSVRPEPLESASRWLAVVASEWDRRLAALKRLAEDG
jgi:ArsR family transcriptional regulator, cadmium/lead-responsive transcriptional repressor